MQPFKNRLFDPELPHGEFIEFKADGFTHPVSGVVYHNAQVADGMPMGGIGTGHIDLGSDGTLGNCTIFGSTQTRRKAPGGPTVACGRDLGAPFMALAVDSKCWVLTLRKIVDKSFRLQLGGYGARRATDIHYWGHYPIADLEFELDAPVGVSLRTFSPLILGDAETSATPGIVFEVRLRNTSASQQRGSVALSFPGPLPQEIRHGGVTPAYPKWDGTFQRRVHEGEFSGIEVRYGVNGRENYALGVAGERQMRHGDALGAGENYWSSLTSAKLPQPQPDSPGATVAVEFDLGASEHETIHFVLAWHDPISYPFRRYYCRRFSGALESARFLAREHESLLQRILAWQQAIYSATEYPVWLRDCLVNSFYALIKNARWVYSPHPDDWFGPNGLFYVTEIMTAGLIGEPIVDRLHGHFPALFFFPQLDRLTLSACKYFQLANGLPPFLLDPYSPVYHSQHTITPAFYIQSIYRHYVRTGDERFLKEYYPSVKAAMRYLQTRDIDGDGMVDDIPYAEEGENHPANQWMDRWPWYGTTVLSGNIFLAALRTVEAIATQMADEELAEDCRAWFDRGMKAFDEQLWTGEYYRLYSDRQTGRCSDTVFADQFASHWMTNVMGLGDVFPQDRVRSATATVKRLNYAATRFGVKNAIRPDGTDDLTGGDRGDATGILFSENLAVALTLIYDGQEQWGMEIARRLMDCVVIQQKSPWNINLFIDATDGSAVFMPFHYQAMILWALPLAINRQGIGEFCAAGGLVDRIIKADRQIQEMSNRSQTRKGEKAKNMKDSADG